MCVSFQLTGESQLTVDGVRVYRIRALRNIPHHGVRKGDRGGWVASERTAKGKPRLGKHAWLSGEAMLLDQARLSGSAHVSGHAVVRGRASIRGNARVYGEARVAGRAQVTGHARVFGFASVVEQAHLTGHAQVFDSAIVAGKAVVAGMSWVRGHASVAEQARVVGDSELTQFVRVSGRAKVEDVTLEGQVEISDDAHLFGGARVPCYGRIGGTASVGDSSHCVLLSPFGPAGETLMITRQRDNSPRITLGGWAWDSWKEFHREVRRWECRRWRQWLPILRAQIKAWRVATAPPAPGLSFELTNVQKAVGLSPEVLVRIRATRDIPEQGVRRGDLGGWVAGAFTSSGEPRIAGTAWLHENAELRGDARIQENARVFGKAVLDDSVIADGNACIGGAAEVTGRCRVTGNAVVEGHACLADDVFVCRDAYAGGNAWLSGSISLFDDARVAGNAVIRGDAWLAAGADITEGDHVKSFENIGPGRNVTLYRSSDGSLRIVEDEWDPHSWSVQEFDKQIRARNWDDPVWLAEYHNVLRVAQLLSRRWA